MFPDDTSVSDFSTHPKSDPTNMPVKPGSPNVFVLGLHKLLYSSSRAERLTQCGCFGKHFP